MAFCTKCRRVVDAMAVSCAHCGYDFAAGTAKYATGRDWDGFVPWLFLTVGQGVSLLGCAASLYWFGKFTLAFFDKVAGLPNKGLPPTTWDEVLLVVALGLAGPVGFCYNAGMFIVFGRTKFSR